MSNKIFEELPSRKGGEAKQPMGDAAASIEKRARQLVYDSRYEVKKMLAGKKADAATQERLVLERIAKSTSIPAVKARARQMISKNPNVPNVAENFIPTIQDAAATSIADAMFKVFVEGVDEVLPDYLEELKGLDDKKYKIRVTDPKTGNSYVRYGTREKITQLRSKGLKVELTEYGEPREGERKRGEETARATGGGSGRKLDPVGKEDSDVDNDGQHNDPNDKYIMKRRAAIGAAIEKKKTVSASYEIEGERLNENPLVGLGIKAGLAGVTLLAGKQVYDKAKEVAGKIEQRNQKTQKAIDSLRKEDYLWAEGTDSTEGTGKKLNPKKVDNYSSGVVKVSPEDGSQSNMKGPKSVYAHTELEGEVIAETGYKKFLNMLQEKAVSQNQQQLAAMAIEYLDGNMPDASDAVKQMAKMGRKELKKFAKTKHKGLPEKVEEEASCGDEMEKKDTRGDYAKVNMIKNKLRAMGAKNPIVMVASEETVEEGMGLSVGASRLGAAILSNPRTSYEQGAKNLQKNLTDPVGFAIKGAIKGAANTLGAGTNTNDKMIQKRQPQTPLQKQVATKTQQVVNQSYEPEGEVLDERRRSEKGTPRKPRNRAMELVRSMPSTRQGLMTRSGKTVAQHEGERGVSERDRPQRPEQTTADRLALKKQREQAAKAAAQRASQDMYKPRAGESD
jgi:hypothetical protein